MTLKVKDLGLFFDTEKDLFVVTHSISNLYAAEFDGAAGKTLSELKRSDIECLLWDEKISSMLALGKRKIGVVLVKHTNNVVETIPYVEDPNLYKTIDEVLIPPKSATLPKQHSGNNYVKVGQVR